MESNTSEKSTNKIDALRFYASKPLMVQRTVIMCDIVDPFLPKLFWYFLRIFLTAAPRSKSNASIVLINSELIFIFAAFHRFLYLVLLKHSIAHWFSYFPYFNKYFFEAWNFSDLFFLRTWRSFSANFLLCLMSHLPLMISSVISSRSLKCSFHFWGLSFLLSRYLICLSIISFTVYHPHCDRLFSTHFMIWFVWSSLFVPLGMC